MILWLDTPQAKAERELERLQVAVIAAIMAKDLHPEAFDIAISNLRGYHVQRGF